MRKSILGCLLAASVFAIGCQDDANISSTLDKPTFEEFVASVYQEPDTGLYIIDFDVPVASAEGLRPYYNALYSDNALTVHLNEGVDAVWDDTQKHQLSYCVSDSFGARKEAVVNAMADATKGWMTSADLTFVYDPKQDSNCTASNNNVLFDVNPVNEGQYIARAFFPGMPRDQRNVLIDESAWDIPDDSVFTLDGVLAHELGHALGFRHEHVRAPFENIPFENLFNCILEGLIDQNYRDVTEYDSDSVMHYPQCGGTGTLQITDLDRTGAAELYGDPRG